jgi:hypothetical protein
VKRNNHLTFNGHSPPPVVWVDLATVKAHLGVRVPKLARNHRSLVFSPTTWPRWHFHQRPGIGATDSGLEECILRRCGDVRVTNSEHEGRIKPLSETAYSSSSAHLGGAPTTISLWLVSRYEGFVPTRRRAWTIHAGYAGTPRRVRSRIPGPDPTKCFGNV